MKQPLGLFQQGERIETEKGFWSKSDHGDSERVELPELI